MGTRWVLGGCWVRLDGCCVGTRWVLCGYCVGTR